MFWELAGCLWRQQRLSETGQQRLSEAGQQRLSEAGQQRLSEAGQQRLSEAGQQFFGVNYMLFSLLYSYQDAAAESRLS